MRVLSVDPGAVHVGVAYWYDLHGLWACESAVEMTPTEFADAFLEMADSASPPDLVIIEGFWLKPGKAALQQAGSGMETVELIGLTKYVCRSRGIEWRKVANGQDAIIARLTAAGYEWASKGHGGHAKDAEAVGARGLSLSVKDIASCQKV